MKFTNGIFLLSITAIIWGTAFIFQSSGALLLDNFTFNAVRFTLGGLVLLPVLIKKKIAIKPHTIKIGIVLGITLFLAANLQQFAMSYTSVSKAGFVTSIYILLVPVLAFVFYKKSTNAQIMLSVLIALVGLYFLCDINENFNLKDSIMLFSAFFFALQIILIDQYGSTSNVYLLAVTQYFTVGLISLIISLYNKDFNLALIYQAKTSILYTGVLSTGIAYTLQIIGQTKTSPTVASIIMSLESLIACIAGFLILNEQMTNNEILGSILLFSALIFSQINFKKTT